MQKKVLVLRRQTQVFRGKEINIMSITLKRVKIHTYNNKVNTANVNIWYLLVKSI